MKANDIMIFKQAIINEVEGFEFYKMAAHNAGDESIRQSFLTLANEELKHIDWLKDAFQKLGGAGEQVKLATFDAPPSPGIFKWENLKTQNANLSVSVFGIAIEMERASVAFYKEAQGKTSYEAARLLFEVLEKWEQGHLEQFSSVYDTLIKEWWNDQGFDAF
ncbi:MAG: hypothetical protein PWQ12_474 [Clostridiales bacterium]|jgi:rubrerythrin|nr:hypothetical protein [Clostridiales bacterium]